VTSAFIIFFSVFSNRLTIPRLIFMSFRPDYMYTPQSAVCRMKQPQMR
jgi:hypothetical protein